MTAHFHEAKGIYLLHSNNKHISGQALVWCGMSKFGVIYCGMALWFLLELSIKTKIYQFTDFPQKGQFKDPGLQELNNQLRYGQYHLPMGVDGQPSPDRL